MRVAAAVRAERDMEPVLSSKGGLASEHWL